MKKKNKAASELGRMGGLAKSKKKALSARKNGKLGGRPPKAKHRHSWTGNGASDFRKCHCGSVERLCAGIWVREIPWEVVK